MPHPLAAWLALLRCPAAESILRPQAAALVCAACAGRYPAEGAIVRVVQAERRRHHLPASARPHALLVQADACRPPLAAGMFNKVGAFGLLHHLPTDDMRRQAVRAAARLLAPGGTFTAAVYHWSQQKRAAAAR